MRTTKSAAVKTDVAALCVGSVLALAAAFWFDAFEKFGRWARPYEAWEIDEFFFVPMVVALALGFFSFRRWRELRREAAEREVAEEALRESEERFRSLVRHASDTITILDASGTISYESPAVERVVGYRPEELVGTDAFGHVHPDDRGRLLEAFADALADPAAGAVLEPLEVSFRHKDGSYRNLEVVGNNLLSDPAVGGIVLNSRDVTERKELEENLRHRALHDGLTGLPNRALFSDRLGHAVRRAGRHGEPVAVLFLDLDNFKYVNDSLGHDAGDELLVAAAKRLGGCLRPGDTLARLGGDEFVALLEEVDGVGGATEVADRLLGALTEPFAVGGGHEAFVTASVGVSLSAPRLGGGGRTEDDLLRDADAAMYRAKASGKSGYEVFDPSMHEEALERLGLENALRRALGNPGNAFEVRYQPKVSLASGEIVGFEALARWERPGRGPVSPARFVPLAEETGLIVPLDRWVLGEACRRAREWSERYPADPPLAMSVNLSARQFGDPGLASDVARVLKESGLEARALTLEITETILMEDVRSAVGALWGLKDTGVRIEVDDFGTGYSSLAYLKRFPVDYLKIDRSFVEGLGRDPEDLGIASAVVNLAHTLGIEALAEGVETGEQLGHLREMGCDLAQGNYFWRPLSVEEAGELLAAYQNR